MTEKLLDAQNQHIADFLIDYVDEVAPLTTLLQQYQFSSEAVKDLIQLTDALRLALVEVVPSAVFVEQLLFELIDSRSSRRWWNRVPSVPMRLPAIREIQQLSNRTKLAAGLGGITLVYLTARSLSYILSLRQQESPTNELVA